MGDRVGVVVVFKLNQAATEDFEHGGI